MTSFDEVLQRLEQLLKEVEVFPPQIRDTVFEILDGVDLMHRMALDRLATRLGPGALADVQMDPLVSWLFTAYGHGSTPEDKRASDPAPRSTSEIAAVIEDASDERRPAIVRTHLERLAKAPPEDRQELVGEWIDLQADRKSAGMELAAAWLGGLVETPPDQMEEMIRSSLKALETRSEDTARTYRSQISRAMAGFYVPQWMRLKDTFNRVATELGQPASWG